MAHATVGETRHKRGQLSLFIAAKIMSKLHQLFLTASTMQQLPFTTNLDHKQQNTNKAYYIYMKISH